ncbi:MAG: 3'(2'),5'-bisphosphate nucleotidase [Phycisphaerales bacterium]|nr:3'(2'),5'-bisphosphate nucleotidase [Phycisphaerales bacterium]
MIDQKHISIARSAVEKASLVTRHVQQRLASVRSMTKDDRSPVTIADFASQAVVARELARRLGGVRLVAEESGGFLREPEHKVHLRATIAALRESGAWPDASEDAVLGAIDRGAQEPDPGGTFWTLDPIDGTKGFLRSQQYCIALALIERGEVALGAMACPNLPRSSGAAIDALAPAAGPVGVVFHAVRGAGAFDPVRMATRSPSIRPPVRVAESMEAAHSDHDAAARIMNRAAGAGGYKAVRLDSQCKYAVVARAQADVYLRLPVKPGYIERIWDHAAGSLIARESGCSVTDINGKPLDFARGHGLEANQGVVVAPPDLHARVISAIAELRPA